MWSNIEWYDIKSRRCLFMHFDKHFSEENAKNAVNRITSMIKSSAHSFVMVWECTDMTNYDTAARDVWQKFLKDIKPRLEAIHLISSNFLIRVGGSVVGSFVGIKILTWSDMEQFRAGFSPNS